MVFLLAFLLQRYEEKCVRGYYRNMLQRRNRGSQNTVKRQAKERGGKE